MATTIASASFDVRHIAARDGKTTAAIVPELGGIVSSFVAPVKGMPRETLFLHDWFWDRAAKRTRGGIPFIFPICGRLERDGAQDTYLYRGRRHTMPPHGFASRMAWRVAGRSRADGISLEFKDTPDTRAMYPFSFHLELRYHVAPGRLVCAQTYANTGKDPMPFYAGFHPYFLTPPGSGKRKTRVAFNAVRAFKYNAALTDIVDTKPVPRTPRPIVSPALDELLAEAVLPATASLLFPDGHSLTTSARGIELPGMFAYLQFYTMPDKPFFCMEPWMGFPNALNTVAGARWLAPGTTMHGVFSCVVE